MGDQKSEWQAEELTGNHILQRDGYKGIGLGAWRSSWGKEVAGGTWRMQLDQGKDPVLNLNLKISRTRVGRQKEGSEAESLRSPGMWAFLVGHKLPFCPLLPGDQ